MFLLRVSRAVCTAMWASVQTLITTTRNIGRRIIIPKRLKYGNRFMKFTMFIMGGRLHKRGIDPAQQPGFPVYFQRICGILRISTYHTEHEQSRLSIWKRANGRYFNTLKNDCISLYVYETEKALYHAVEKFAGVSNKLCIMFRLFDTPFLNRYNYKWQYCM